MKKAIRYLRFSSDDQSQHSIERQDLVTNAWMKQHDVFLTDTFKDEGYSAKNFDRPDIKELFSFIQRNFRQIDYLVVSELTRFSRDAGEALSTLKEIQKKYNIRIVSAGTNRIYDFNDSSSYFLMGIEFLLGTTENIKRTTDINGGVYTAKAVKGKFIQGGPSPYGYKKVGTGDQRRLVVEESEAAVIRHIFDQYLKNVPVYLIRQQAIQMGFRRKGSSAIQEVLTSPLYISYQIVKAWDNKPGGLFPIKDLPPIIDKLTWQKVQEKFNGPKYKKTIADELPLRGLLRCHCSKRLTGAPSTNKIGKQFLYYKCSQSKHLNLSAKNAHEQLQEMLPLLSLPSYMIDPIKEETKKEMLETHSANRKQLVQARNDLAKIEEDIFTVEDKFISKKTINDETFQRWHEQLSNNRIKVAARIEKFSRDEHAAWLMISEDMNKLSDLQWLYNNISTPDKQELLRQVFDDCLYYKEGSYRTPWIMDTFTHNLLILKDNNLLVIDGMDYQNDGSPVKWTPPSHNRTLPSLLSFISKLKVA